MDSSSIHNMNGGYQGGGYGLEQTNTNGQGEENGGESEGPKYSDINMILDQILTMSDQNIDEAQVLVAFIKLKLAPSVIFYSMWNRLGNTPSTVTV